MNKTYILIAVGVTALIISITLGNTLTEIFSLLFVGAVSGNAVAKHRKEKLGEKDKQGFEQKPVIEVDIVEPKEKPSGIKKDKISVEIEQSPTISITVDEPKKQPSAAKLRETLKNQKGYMKFALIFMLLFPAICKADVTLTDEQYAEVDTLLMYIETVQTEKPKYEVIKPNSIIITEEGQVFSKDNLKLRLWLPAKEDPKTNVFDYTLDIDLNTDVTMKRKEKSWWERNDFMLGVVVGGTVVTVSVVGIALLLN